MTRFTDFKTWLKQEKLDAAIVTSPIAIFELTGYLSDPHERFLALFVSAKDNDFLMTPALEVNMAEEKTDIPVFGATDDQNPYEEFSKHIKKEDKILNIAVEYDHFTYGRMTNIKKFTPFSIKEDATSWLEYERMFKTPEQIKLLIESGEKADLMTSLVKKHIKTGITETQLKNVVEQEMHENGIEEFSFSTLILFGDHAADPHGEPGDRVLQDNEFVLADLGVMWKGYASDMTRMFYNGDVASLSEHHKKIHDLVQLAHDKAIAEAKIGMTASEVDQIARDVITDGGYGDYFIHRLGHGIGRSCHEYPSIVEGSDLEIKPGMCFSIEPGIYIHGDIGVRIEDCGYMSEEGFIKFTHSPYLITQ
ncbi:M24 family metallopeptidase [Bavariicoccus seileri]|uniref:M24 family metallopeptidase n=1 Tax=Bavariicoccus seileri TaxID=549685 RepID=UPI003F9131D3